MNDQMLLVAFCVIAGVALLFIITSICVYKIGYNNGCDAGFRAGRRELRKTQSVNLPDRQYSEAESVRVLPPRSERPVYIDSRSKYESVDYDKNY